MRHTQIGAQRGKRLSHKIKKLQNSSSIESSKIATTISFYLPTHVLIIKYS